MLVIIGLGFENHLTIRAVVFHVVLGLLSFRTLSMDIATWFCCLGPCIVKVLKLVIAYLTRVFMSIHEVVFYMVSESSLACKRFLAQMTILVPVDCGYMVV